MFLRSGDHMPLQPHVRSLAHHVVRNLLADFISLIAP